MNRLIVLIFLLFTFNSFAQIPDLEDQTKSFKNIAAMKARTGKAGAIYNVKGFYSPNDGGGGSFYWDNQSTETTYAGIVEQVSGVTTGRWKRVVVNKTITSKATGAKGDGTTDDRAAFQVLVDYLNAVGGGTIDLLPVNTYYRDTLPIYWKSNVNMVGHGEKSKIKNDRDTTGSTQGFRHAPIFFGEHIARSYDSTNLPHYNTNTIRGNQVQLTTSTDIDSFSVGELVMVRGLTGFLGAGNIIRPHVMRLEMITAKIAPNIIVLEHPLDTILTAGKIAPLNRFKPTAPQRLNEWGNQRYAISNIYISNLSLETTGQLFLRYCVYKGTFDKIWTVGAEGVGGNSMAWNNYSNINSKFWKQVTEFAMGSHNTVIENYTATWIKDTFLISDRQPLIRFGENVHSIKITNLFVDAGNSERVGFTFDDADNCSIENFTFFGRRIKQQMLEFNTGRAYAYNHDNKFINGNVYGDSVTYWIKFNSYSNDSSILSRNSAINISFHGVNASSNGVIGDGIDNEVIDSRFPTGEIGAGTSAIRFRSIRNKIANVYTKKANVISINDFNNNEYAQKIWTNDKIVAIGNNKPYSDPVVSGAQSLVIIGNQAMDSLVNATNSIAIGDSALTNNKAGSGNVAVGVRALKKFTGNNSIAFGYQSQMENISGNNTSVGHRTLEVSTGGFNSAFGFSAGLANTTGARNLFMMNGAGNANTTGNDNIYIGNASGQNNTTSSFNTVIGNSGSVLDATNGNSLNFLNNIFGLGVNTTTGTNAGAGRFGVNNNSPTAYWDITAATSNYASLRLRNGTAPTSPNSGDVWTTTTGGFIQSSTTTLKFGQRVGSSTQSGDGTTTSFTIAHGLGTTPTFFAVTPSNTATAGISYLTADATNITVVYTVAPASGSNNLIFKWNAIP